MGLRKELKAAYKHNRAEIAIPAKEPQGWFNFRLFSVLESVGFGTRPSGWLVPVFSLFTGGLFTISQLWFGFELRYSMAAGSTIACASSILYTLAYYGLIVTHVVEDRQTNGPVEIVDEKPIDGWQPVPDLSKDAELDAFVAPAGIMIYVGPNGDGRRLYVNRQQIHALAERIREGKVNIPYSLVDNVVFKRRGFDYFKKEAERAGVVRKTYRNETVWTQDAMAAVELYDRSTPLPM